MLLSRVSRVFVYPKPIDMRWSFERLSYLVRKEMEYDVDYGDWYLFLGKNRRRLKILWYDGSGLNLLVKRMEKKSFMDVLECEREITRSELMLLMHGSVLKKYLPKSRRDKTMSYGSKSSQAVKASGVSQA